MNWLITGGCGFIGTSLIRRLIESHQHSIRVVDNLSVGSRDDIAQVCTFDEIDADKLGEQFGENRIQLIIGDILDENLALKVSQDIDIIVHLAANTGVGPSVEDPRSDCYANVIGTLNYLEAARINKVPRFVFASSGAPAGEVDPPIHEELPPHPVSPYGASKLAGEGYCSAYAKTFGIQTVMLRFGNVYGPGSIHKSSVVAKFINRALKNEKLEIFGNGKQTRDFIYIDDLTNAIILASEKDNIAGEAFQIATNRETTVGEMTEILIEKLKSHGVDHAEIVNTEARLGDVMRNYSDTSKAKQRLGWAATVELQEGLDKTIRYFLTEGLKDVT